MPHFIIFVIQKAMVGNLPKIMQTENKNREKAQITKE